MKTFKEYKDFKLLKEEYETEFYGQIDESGANLSRILKQTEDNQFVLLSASRAKYSKKENHKRNNDLLNLFKTELKGSNVGAYKLIGHWKECSKKLKDKQNIKDCEGTITNALEESWLIIKPPEISLSKLEEVAQKASKKFDQDAYMVKDTRVILKGKDSTVFEDLGEAGYKSLSTGFNKIVNKQGYSELAKLRRRGRIHNIVFENVYNVTPKDCISSKRVFQSQNILY